MIPLKKYKLYTHLVVHIILGVAAIFAAESTDRGATLAGIGILISYLTAALLSIICSIVVLTHVQKAPSAAVWKFLVIVIPLWIFSPYIVSRVSELLPDLSNSESNEKALKEHTLKAMRNLGIKQCQWDSIRRCYSTTSRSRKVHYLAADKHTLIIYSQIKPPAATDTIQWMETLFINAIDYISLKTVLVLNDCLKNGNYDFNFTPNIRRVSLTLGPPTPYDPNEDLITGESDVEQTNEGRAELRIKINRSKLRGN